MNDLQGKELLHWLRDGLRDNSLQAEPGHDAILDKYNDMEDVVPEGSPTAGYRVMYTYVDPGTGKRYYQTPLTVGRNLSLGGMEQDFKAAAQHEGAETRYLMKDDEGIHHTDEGPGFYYFRDKDVAEDYMKVVALGLKNVRGGASFADNWYIEHNDTYGIGRNGTPDISLALFRVEGTAMPKPGDEGETMNDMYIDPEPVVNISLRSVYDLGKQMTQTLRNPENLKKLHPDTQRLAIFTGAGDVFFDQGYSSLLRATEGRALTQAESTFKMPESQIKKGWEDQKRFERETIFKEVFEQITGFDYGPVEPAKPYDDAPPLPGGRSRLGF